MIELSTYLCDGTDGQYSHARYINPSLEISTPKKMRKQTGDRKLNGGSRPQSSCDLNAINLRAVNVSGDYEVELHFQDGR